MSMPSCTAIQKDKVSAIVSIPQIDDDKNSEISSIARKISDRYDLIFVDVSADQSKVDHDTSSIYIGIYKMYKKDRYPIVIVSDAEKIFHPKVIILDGPYCGYSRKLRKDLIGELTDRWPTAIVEDRAVGCHAE
jgi:hypothetical protein